eukprot:COSAG01_NODE_11356_length_1952_cov_1.996762_2_plen_169_part_00
MTYIRQSHETGGRRATVGRGMVAGVAGRGELRLLVVRASADAPAQGNHGRTGRPGEGRGRQAPGSPGLQAQAEGGNGERQLNIFRPMGTACSFLLTHCRRACRRRQAWTPPHLFGTSPPTRSERAISHPPLPPPFSCYFPASSYSSSLMLQVLPLICLTAFACLPSCF